MQATALELARLSKLSYRKHTFVLNDVEVLVQEYEDVICIAFRGTELNLFSEGGLIDIIRDLRAYPWYDKEIGWCHAGILKGARSIWYSILLNHLKELNKPLVFTGHSLGGGLALVSAILALSANLEVSKVITFGAPRCLTSETLDRLNEVEVIQFKNGSDVITETPKRFWGYQHRNLITLGHDGWLPSVHDHRIERYIEALIQWQLKMTSRHC